MKQIFLCFTFSFTTFDYIERISVIVSLTHNLSPLRVFYFSNISKIETVKLSLNTAGVYVLENFLVHCQNIIYYTFLK